MGEIADALRRATPLGRPPEKPNRQEREVDRGPVAHNTSSEPAPRPAARVETPGKPVEDTIHRLTGGADDDSRGARTSCGVPPEPGSTIHEVTLPNSIAAWPFDSPSWLSRDAPGPSRS